MTLDMNAENKLDVDGVYWAMSISGKNIDYTDKLQISSITIDESVKGSDTLTVAFYDPEMRFIEDDLYLKDVPISFDMWYHGSTEKSSFYGYISEIHIEFPEMGSPRMELYCLDKTHLMQRVKNTQTWDNVRSIDIVRQKCARYGFNLVSQVDYIYIREESISQSDQTDIEFLESLANSERELFVAKLVGDTFFYVRLGIMSDPSFELYYRDSANRNNVKYFNPTIDKESRQVDVRYADLITKTKTVAKFYANLVTVALQTQGYPVDVSEVAYGSVPYDDTEYQKMKRKMQEQAQSSSNSSMSSTNGESGSGSSEAERTFRNIEYNTLRGECSLIPKADVLGMRYMQTVNFTGLGRYLSGLYFVEGIKRTLDGENGYSQTLTLIKTGFADNLKPKEMIENDEVKTNDSNYEVGEYVTIPENSDLLKLLGGTQAMQSTSIGGLLNKRPFTVAEVDESNRKVLLKEIYRWADMDIIEKV